MSVMCSFIDDLQMRVFTLAVRTLSQVGIEASVGSFVERGHAAMEGRSVP